MLRGRREYCIWVISYLFFVSFIMLTLFIPIKIYSSDSVMQVSATVSVSKEWKQAIINNSEIYLDSNQSELLKPVKLKIISKGMELIKLPMQKLYVRILLKNSIIFEQNILSNDAGEAGIVFIPEKYGEYTIKIINTTYSETIELNPTFFSIHEPNPILVSIIKTLEDLKFW